MQKGDWCRRNGKEEGEQPQQQTKTYLDVDDHLGAARWRSAVKSSDDEAVERLRLSVELPGDDQVEEQLVVRSALNRKAKRIAHVAWTRRRRWWGNGRGKDGKRRRGRRGERGRGWMRG